MTPEKLVAIQNVAALDLNVFRGDMMYQSRRPVSLKKAWFFAIIP